MSVDLPDQEGVASQTAGRTLDLAAAGLALARLAVEAFAEAASEVSNAQAEAVQKASEQVISAIGGLPGMPPGQRNIAAEISCELSTLATDLVDDSDVGLSPALVSPGADVSACPMMRCQHVEYTATVPVNNHFLGRGPDNDHSDPAVAGQDRRRHSRSRHAGFGADHRAGNRYHH